MINRKSRWELKEKPPFWLKENRCSDCQKPCGWFRRCKVCYYKRKGWDNSRLLGNRKQEGRRTPSVQMNEPARMLKDSTERFGSGSEYSAAQTLNHSELALNVDTTRNARLTSQK